MIKAVIIEDETHCYSRLNELIEKLDQDIQVLKWFQSITDAQEYLEKERVDLLFLDVELQDGTAFEMLHALEELDFEIIFTTAHNNYAQQAFDYSAVHYLLKPIEYERLSNALERVVQRKGNNGATELKELLHNLEVHTSLDKKLAIPTVEGLEFVKTGEIQWIQADSNYSRLYLSGGREVIVSKTLKYFEKLLDNHYFSRVHQSHIVNLGYVKKYLKGQGGALILESGVRIPVSVRKKEEFLKQLSKNKQI